jgi:hemolysin activation/secretion protein
LQPPPHLRQAPPFFLQPKPAALATLGALLLLPAAGALAQTVPDAGRAIGDLERPHLNLPPRQPLDLHLPEEEEAPDPAASADTTRVAVSAFHITGNTAIDASTLTALLADLAGRELSLAELRAAARRITRLYREQGYPLARAWLPRQEIQAGMVRIDVMEGRFGEVRIDNRSTLRAPALAPLETLEPGAAVRAEPLERALLLTRDLAGVAVKSTLQPGASVGTTDLLVELTPADRTSGSLELDNFGNRYTGEWRLGANLEVANPLGLGDRLNLRLLGSEESQWYGRVGWQGSAGPWGTRLGAAYSRMRYELGRDFTALQATGLASIASLWVTQPLVRRRDVSLYAALQFDDKRLRDDVGRFASHQQKRSQVWSATLSGNASDGLAGGGLSSFSLAASSGRLDLEDPAARALDAASARTQGGFGKLNASLARLQQLAGPFSLYGQIEGQWANGNLDSAEKMVLGGAYGVRAYPQGEAAGDRGWLARLELRYALSPAWQLAAFADHGETRSSTEPWIAGRNHRTLSGAGLGASWQGAQWRLQASAAWKVGNAAATSGPERQPRIWLLLARDF